ANREIDINSLKEHLSAYLTAYMVPQAFMQLDEMPLTANGKIDKKVLPVIEIAEEEIVPAENEMQDKILGIAKEVTGADRIGITTDLFAAGLSSIGSIKLCSMLSDAFDVAVKVAEIFERKTVKQIETLINEKSAEETVSYELRESYPLTKTQMGIYVDSETYSGMTVYNIPYLYKLDSRVNLEKLRIALQKTVIAHPYLFMTLRDDNGKIKAVRNKAENIDIQISDAPPVPDNLVRPYDLTSGERLFRIELFDTNNGKYLSVDTHHIISDGESLTIFFDDLNRAYSGEEIETEQFTGYEAALDEEAALKTDRPEKAKLWYDSIFLGCGGETVPIKDGKPSERTIANTEYVGKSNADRVREYCEENGLSQNAFFTAAFGMALQSYTASEKAVFSTIYNGRSDSRTARSISMFVKTLPVWSETKQNATVKETIADCRNYLLSAMANDIYSFAEISKAYGIGADILFAFQGEMSKIDETEFCGYPVSVEEVELSQAKALFGLDIILDGDKVLFEIEYDPTAYSEYTINGITRLMDQVINEFLTKENISDISFVSNDDEKAILSLHDTDFKVEEKPAYRLLQDSAEKYPDRNAVIAVDRTLTYRELNEEANALGHLLRDNGAQPETIVAVMAERDSYA
ncbi:MAG: AMP-binding protein, partial [Clostridia bacterium]|nr:AMP-binding protein [Clostridia bacterium]